MCIRDRGRLTHEGGLSSSTRAVWGGGTFYNPSVAYHDIIDYVTIATTGNATDFGDMTVNRKAMAAVSSSTRGIWSGGYTPTYQNVKDYITIATTGTATEFGDSNVAETYLGCMASPTRALQGTGAYATNAIVYYNIATTGNYVDFGDAIESRAQDSGTSNAHGGLG